MNDEVTIETLMIGATMRGLSLEMFETMKPGQIVDYCIAYNNTVGSYKNDNEIVASQAEFDAF